MDENDACGTLRDAPLGRAAGTGLVGASQMAKTTITRHEQTLRMACTTAPQAVRALKTYFAAAVRRGWTSQMARMAIARPNRALQTPYSPARKGGMTSRWMRKIGMDRRGAVHDHWLVVVLNSLAIRLTVEIGQIKIVRSGNYF